MNTAKCYLWAVKGENIPVGEMVTNRYQVVAPQVWLDTQPEEMPSTPSLSHPKVLPYLSLSSYHLHLPQLYGAVQIETDAGKQSILLLDRIPITAEGMLYPSIIEAWAQAPPVRQVYWLWQLSQLWTPLIEYGAAASLLTPENIRVQGWRVWLRELLFTSSPPSLEALSRCWQGWIESCPADVREQLALVCQTMSEGGAWEAILPSLNQILLELAAELPLKIVTAGGSEMGPVRSHNEDSCYPVSVSSTDSSANLTREFDRIPQLAMVCDGLDGHQGGEVASELAVRSLKLQVQGLLVELAEQTEVVMPAIWMEHITSVIRIVNNLISTQNDLKGRSGRERMGTTLVMALQIAQKVRTDLGLDFPNTHELYLAHVGDSRAYWITPHYCQLLTDDHDLAHWQVLKAEASPRQARAQANALQLIQALGTQHADRNELVPNVQRLIIDEDGILLLCSDGLSDRGWIEQCWHQDINQILAGEIRLEEAVQHWLELGNSDNNPDNLSVVLMYCRVSPQEGVELSTAQELNAEHPLPTGTINASLAPPESPEFVLQQVSPENSPSPLERPIQASKPVRYRAIAGVFLALLLLGAGFGAWYWGFVDLPGLNRSQELRED